jgi:hypothetical protein
MFCEIIHLCDIGISMPNHMQRRYSSSEIGDVEQMVAHELSNAAGQTAEPHWSFISYRGYLGR